jgi:hypothetical protein
MFDLAGIPSGDIGVLAPQEDVSGRSKLQRRL